MARLVKHTATGPVDITTDQGDVVSICLCGLTADPTAQCDKTHKKLREKITTKPEDDSLIPCYDPKQRDKNDFPINLNCDNSCENCQCA